MKHITSLLISPEEFKLSMKNLIAAMSFKRDIIKNRYAAAVYSII